MATILGSETPWSVVLLVGVLPVMAALATAKFTGDREDRRRTEDREREDERRRSSEEREDARLWLEERRSAYAGLLATAREVQRDIDAHAEAVRYNRRVDDLDWDAAQLRVDEEIEPVLLMGRSDVRLAAEGVRSALFAWGLEVSFLEIVGVRPNDEPPLVHSPKVREAIEQFRTAARSELGIRDSEVGSSSVD